MSPPRIRIDPTTRTPIDDPGGAHAGPPPSGDPFAGVAKELIALRRAISERPKRYVELSARTNFSFLSGATPPELMVFRAAELGYDAIAITDRDGLYGIVRAHEEGEKQGVRVIVGCELTLEQEGLDVPAIPGKPTTLTVLVENHVGYTNLCRILTKSHERHPKSRPTARTENLDEDELPKNTFAGIPLSFVCQYAEGLWALADATLPIGELHRAFGPRLSIAVHLHKDGEDRARVTRAETAARTHGVALCATNRVLFANAEDKPIQDILHCIREGVTLDEAGRDLLPNAEPHLKSEEEMLRLFSLHPAWIDRSRVIADRCRFSIKELSYRFPYEISDLVHRDFQGTVGETADQALRRLTEQGVVERYPDGIPEKVRTQIDKELDLISKLEVAPYFLSVRAIVDMARRRDILCQGRGSAANSAVCYVLGITAVDPARSNLLFERFLSAERREPPDIDVDFEHERREEVIQEIYSTYGRDRAALVCEVVSYRAKSALREVGKVFGFSLEQVERLAGVVSWWDGVSAVSESRLKAIGLSAHDPAVRRTVSMARALQGFPRHLSIHVGGFVLSAAPLDRVAPVEPATMENRTIIPWDKDDIDTLGFFKIDVLGLGMLTALRKALDLVRDNAKAEPSYALPRLVNGTAIERLAAIPAEAPEVYDALCAADTVGVFQIESRAQMAMLPRLQPRRFYDLVIEVAIVRPGPIQGGMVHPYLRRRTGEEPAESPHPILNPILDRTLGVPLFQEQVMQIAIVGAGYTGGEADRLRRDMAAWRKTGSLEKHRARLLTGFRERGISEEFGERLYKQIHGFAEYGFPECVVGQTLVLDASTGKRVPIEDVVNGRAKLKTTFACDSHLRLRERKVIEARRSGPREVYRLRTALGRELLATAEHPLRTMEGWKGLGSLKPGDRVAAARGLPNLGKKRWPRHEIIVLADLIAEGNLCHPTTFYFYSQSDLHRDEYVRMVERFPNTRATVARHHDCHSVHVRRNDPRQPCGARDWADRLGLRGVGAGGKSLPSEVFELENADIALLLARLWEGDGTLSNARHASYDTVSRVLAEQIQHLLLRFEIIARVYERRRQYRGREVTCFIVTITGAENLTRFYEQIAKVFLEPKKKLFARKLARETRGGRMSTDIVPASVREPIRHARESVGCTWNAIEDATALSMREVQARNKTKKGFRRAVVESIGRYLGSRELVDLGTSDVVWDRVVSVEHVGVRETYDLTIEGDANFLANDFVVHNSHSASFSLLVYASSWLKVHYPAEFAAALINSQPMGFYSASTILQDAQRHGVPLAPIDIGVSNWDCSTFRVGHGTEEGEIRKTFIRLGLRLVNQLGEDAGKRIEAARAEKHFESIEDLTARAKLDRKELVALAEAGALDELAGGRRESIWKVVAPRASGLFDGAESEEPRPRLGKMTRAEQLVLDYERTGVSVDDHPMKLLRPKLPKKTLSSKDIMYLRSGTKVSVAGMVICRQRPGTASGVVFVTMEDEFGFSNLVLWTKVFDKYRDVATASRLLMVHGKIERSDDPKGKRPADPNVPQSVVYVIAEKLERLDDAMPSMVGMSRDFH